MLKESEHASCMFAESCRNSNNWKAGRGTQPECWLSVYANRAGALKRQRAAADVVLMKPNCQKVKQVIKEDDTGGLRPTLLLTDDLNLLIFIITGLTSRPSLILNAQNGFYFLQAEDSDRLCEALQVLNPPVSHAGWSHRDPRACFIIIIQSFVPHSAPGPLFVFGSGSVWPSSAAEGICSL